MIHLVPDSTYKHIKNRTNGCLLRINIYFNHTRERPSTYFCHCVSEVPGPATPGWFFTEFPQNISWVVTWFSFGLGYSQISLPFITSPNNVGYGPEALAPDMSDYSSIQHVFSLPACTYIVPCTWNMCLEYGSQYAWNMVINEIKTSLAKSTLEWEKLTINK